MTRKFETVKGYDNATLPQRSTAFSAGYDFVATEPVYVPSLFAIESDNKAKENIEKIAAIPSRDTLISKFMGSIQSPIANFARVVAQIAEQKEA